LKKLGKYRSSTQRLITWICLITFTTTSVVVPGAASAQQPSSTSSSSSVISKFRNYFQPLSTSSTCLTTLGVERGNLSSYQAAMTRLVTWSRNAATSPELSAEDQQTISCLPSFFAAMEVDFYQAYEKQCAFEQAQGLDIGIGEASTSIVLKHDFLQCQPVDRFINRIEPLTQRFFQIYQQIASKFSIESLHTQGLEQIDTSLTIDLLPPSKSTIPLAPASRAPLSIQIASFSLNDYIHKSAAIWTHYSLLSMVTKQIYQQHTPISKIFAWASHRYTAGGAGALQDISRLFGSLQGAKIPWMKDYPHLIDRNWMIQHRGYESLIEKPIDAHAAQQPLLEISYWDLAQNIHTLIQNLIDQRWVYRNEKNQAIMVTDQQVPLLPVIQNIAPMICGSCQQRIVDEVGQPTTMGPWLRSTITRLVQQAQLPSFAQILIFKNNQALEQSRAFAKAAGSFNRVCSDIRSKTQEISDTYTVEHKEELGMESMGFGDDGSYFFTKPNVNGAAEQHVRSLGKSALGHEIWDRFGQTWSQLTATRIGSLAIQSATLGEKLNLKSASSNFNDCIQGRGLIGSYTSQDLVQARHLAQGQLMLNVREALQRHLRYQSPIQEPQDEFQNLITHHMPAVLWYLMENPSIQVTSMILQGFRQQQIDVSWRHLFLVTLPTFILTYAQNVTMIGGLGGLSSRAFYSLLGGIGLLDAAQTLAHHHQAKNEHLQLRKSLTSYGNVQSQWMQALLNGAQSSQETMQQTWTRLTLNALFTGMVAMMGPRVRNAQKDLARTSPDLTQGGMTPRTYNQTTRLMDQRAIPRVPKFNKVDAMVKRSLRDPVQIPTVESPFQGGKSPIKNLDVKRPPNWNGGPTNKPAAPTPRAPSGSQGSGPTQTLTRTRTKPQTKNGGLSFREITQRLEAKTPSQLREPTNAIRNLRNLEAQAVTETQAVLNPMLMINTRIGDVTPLRTMGDAIEEAEILKIIEAPSRRDQNGKTIHERALEVIESKNFALIHSSVLGEIMRLAKNGNESAKEWLEEYFHQYPDIHKSTIEAQALDLIQMKKIRAIESQQELYSSVDFEITKDHIRAIIAMASNTANPEAQILAMEWLCKQSLQPDPEIISLLSRLSTDSIPRVEHNLTALLHDLKSIFQNADAEQLQQVLEYLRTYFYLVPTWRSSPNAEGSIQIELIPKNKIEGFYFESSITFVTDKAGELFIILKRSHPDAMRIYTLNDILAATTKSDSNPHGHLFTLDGESHLSGGLSISNEDELFYYTASNETSEKKWFQFSKPRARFQARPYPSESIDRPSAPTSTKTTHENTGYQILNQFVSKEIQTTLNPAQWNFGPHRHHIGEKVEVEELKLAPPRQLTEIESLDVAKQLVRQKNHNKVSDKIFQFIEKLAEEDSELGVLARAWINQYLLKNNIRFEAMQFIMGQKTEGFTRAHLLVISQMATQNENTELEKDALHFLYESTFNKIFPSLMKYKFFDRIHYYQDKSDTNLLREGLEIFLEGAPERLIEQIIEFINSRFYHTLLWRNFGSNSRYSVFQIDPKKVLTFDIFYEIKIVFLVDEKNIPHIMVSRYHPHDSKIYTVNEFVANMEKLIGPKTLNGGSRPNPGKKFFYWISRNNSEFLKEEYDFNYFNESGTVDSHATIKPRQQIFHPATPPPADPTTGRVHNSFQATNHPDVHQQISNIVSQGLAFDVTKPVAIQPMGITNIRVGEPVADDDDHRNDRPAFDPDDPHHGYSSNRNIPLEAFNIAMGRVPEFLLKEEHVFYLCQIYEHTEKFEIRTRIRELMRRYNFSCEELVADTDDDEYPLYNLSGPWQPNPPSNEPQASKKITDVLILLETDPLSQDRAFWEPYSKELLSIANLLRDNVHGKIAHSILVDILQIQPAEYSYFADVNDSHVTVAHETVEVVDGTSHLRARSTTVVPEFDLLESIKAIETFNVNDKKLIREIRHTIEMIYGLQVYSTKANERICRLKEYGITPTIVRDAASFIADHSIKCYQEFVIPSRNPTRVQVPIWLTGKLRRTFPFVLGDSDQVWNELRLRSRPNGIADPTTGANLSQNKPVTPRTENLFYAVDELYYLEDPEQQRQYLAQILKSSAQNVYSERDYRDYAFAHEHVKFLPKLDNFGITELKDYLLKQTEPFMGHHGLGRTFEFHFAHDPANKIKILFKKIIHSTHMNGKDLKISIELTPKWNDIRMDINGHIHIPCSDSSGNSYMIEIFHPKYNNLLWIQNQFMTQQEVNYEKLVDVILDTAKIFRELKKYPANQQHDVELQIQQDLWKFFYAAYEMINTPVRKLNQRLDGKYQYKYFNNLDGLFENLINKYHPGNKILQELAHKLIEVGLVINSSAVEADLKSMIHRSFDASLPEDWNDKPIFVEFYIATIIKILTRFDTEIKVRLAAILNRMLNAEPEKLEHFFKGLIRDRNHPYASNMIENFVASNGYYTEPLSQTQDRYWLKTIFDHQMKSMSEADIRILITEFNVLAKRQSNIDVHDEARQIYYFDQSKPYPIRLFLNFSLAKKHNNIYWIPAHPDPNENEVDSNHVMFFEFNPENLQVFRLLKHTTISQYLDLTNENEVSALSHYRYPSAHNLTISLEGLNRYLQQGAVDNEKVLYEALLYLMKKYKNVEHQSRIVRNLIVPFDQENFAVNTQGQLVILKYVYAYESWDDVHLKDYLKDPRSHKKQFLIISTSDAIALPRANRSFDWVLEPNLLFKRDSEYLKPIKDPTDGTITYSYYTE
jgi:hypothetical protein